jgi:hypothetical protein
MAYRVIGSTGRILYGLVCLPGLIFCDGFLRGPVTGLIHDPLAKTVHRIDGVPGAAMLSRAIPLEVEVHAAAFDRSQRFALIANPAGEVYLVRDPAGPTPRAERILPEIAGVQKVSLDSDASTAALYSPVNNVVHLVKGLPDSANLSLSVELPSGAEDASLLQVLPSGEGALVAAGREGQAQKILRVRPDGAAVLLAEPTAVQALAVSGPDSFVYADGARNELVRVKGLEPGAEAMILADAASGVKDPRGLCNLPDGGVLLANAGGPAAIVFNADGQRTASLDLAFEPRRCETPGSSAYFLLNDAGRGPLYLLDYSEGPRIVFVPPAPSEANQ